MPRVEVPDEDRLARQLDQPLLLPQLVLAAAQRLFDSAPLGDVDERDDHAVDLVVDGAVGAHAHVVPAIVLAANLTPHRCEVVQHGPRILGEVRRSRAGARSR